MRWLRQRGRSLGDQHARLADRRGLLMSLLGGAGAIAAAVWALRPRSADGRGYQVIARWTIQNGGEGRFIAVDPAPTIAAFRALGERLREEFAAHENAVVMIFDDADAARHVHLGSRTIGEQLFQAALRHQRAMYVKHAEREHRLTIYAPYPVPHETIHYRDRSQGKGNGP